MILPPDLLSAEAELANSLAAALAEQPKGRWSVDLRFEGLRLQQPALRLQAAMASADRPCQLLFADAGATALAKRDAAQQADYLHSLADWQRLQGQSDAPLGDLLIAIAPGPPDYELVEAVCDAHGGAVVLFNGRLEDAAVGIGSVARQRRRGFVSLWRSAYCLQPLQAAALRQAFPEPWGVFRQQPEGYRLMDSFDERPDAEQLDGALSGGHNQGLWAMDRFLKDLSG
jgi:hypothetical protein